MNRFRQFVATLMVLTIASMASAPLLACEAAGHRCAKMSHSAKAGVKHACCHEKGNKTPAPAKQRCHESAAIMPAECAAPANCCDMGNAPLVSFAQAEPAKRTVLAIASDPPPELTLISHGRVNHSTVIPPHPRSVFESKTDLRI